MTAQQQRENARQFINYWRSRGSERREAQQFWNQLLGDVLGMENLNDIQYEKPVYKDGTSGAIDVYIPETNVLIEHKSRNISLDKKERKADGSFLTPYEQARAYEWHLPRSEKPRFIVTCNFKEFWIYDMESPHAEPVKLQLENLQDQLYQLSFLLNKKDVNIAKELEVSVKAGEIVGILYDELYKQYIDPTDPKNLHSLNVLCVRLVFCLYAEDAGIFGHKRMFHDYMEQFGTRGFRDALLSLFKQLDIKPEDRSPYLNRDLTAFPYVNGSLFNDSEEIEIPQFTDKIVDTILNQASKDFDWSHISPTIFGAVFESTLNPETRRTGGMHYTSVENIHKVINPLFLTNLKEEFEEIKIIPVLRTKRNQLDKFHDKLASLKFLDPACGSGNFLTESYVCIRRLENELIKEKRAGQMVIGEAINPIKVSIEQFYGIEINDFAVTVAKTALWIAESQMMKETEDIILQELDFLPLESNACIVEGNALTLDWNDVVGNTRVNFVMGNPPFVGKNEQTPSQKAELLSVFEKQKNVSSLDYVCGWYKLSADYIRGTKVRVAFVSTNSIAQGEQPAVLWKSIIGQNEIDFAYRSFIWENETKDSAAVHCVIIGFSQRNNNSNKKQQQKTIFDGENVECAKNINPYLFDAPDVLIESRTHSLSNVPRMDFGNMPNDSKGLLSGYSDEERQALVKENPELEQWFKPFLGATEFINNKKRWCLWLVNATPNQLRESKFLASIMTKIRNDRLASTRKATNMLADTPHLFGEIRQPKTEYILVPRHSSERRRYIPIGFVNPSIIVGDSNMAIPDTSLYHFGILISNVHSSWVRAVCGRIKSDYRYSKDVVYNNFPWCKPTDEQKAKIEKTAQGILDARELYQNMGSSLADLYDPLTMPVKLRKAHDENNKAVMRAYGFDINSMSESDCVSKLMEMYQELASEV